MLSCPQRGQAPSVKPAQQLLEIAVARLRRRGLEGAAQGGRDAGVRRRDFDADDAVVHQLELSSRIIFSLQVHLLCKRPNPRRSFVPPGFPAVALAR